MAAGWLNPSAGLGAGGGTEDAMAEAVARQRLAKLLAGGQSYTDASPKQHPMQVAAQTVAGMMAGLESREQLASLMSQNKLSAGLGMPPASGAPPGASAASRTADAGAGAAPSALEGDIGRYAEAIKAKESGGKYDIVGPTHAKYGRALGAYQVMEANLPSWSKEALGREVSADEFLKNPALQDQIFAHRFGGYVQKYGNPQDAASAWFTGGPRSTGANKRDVLGTTGAGYVQSFDNALKRQAPQGPVAEAGGDQLGKIQAAMDAKRAGGAGPDTAFTSFLTDGRDPQGGFFVPPEVRAQAPAGDPSALRPGEAPSTEADLMNGPVPADLRGQLRQAAAQSRARDVAALTAPQGMGGEQQGFAPAAPPAPEAQTVPLPPQRPDDSALFRGSEPTPPAAPAPRQRLASELTSKSTASAPAEAAPPAQPPQNREGLARLFGGLQDGLDRVFGGPETQARLDAQAGGAPRYPVPPPGFGGSDGRGGLINRLTDAAPQAPAPGPQRAPQPSGYSALPSPGAPPRAVPSPQVAPAPQGVPQAPVGGPPPAAASAASSPAPMPSSPVGAAPGGAAPAQAPVQVAQAGGGQASPLAPEQEAWLQRYMRMKSQGIDVKAYEPVAAELIKKRFEGQYGTEMRDGRLLSVGQNGQRSLIYDAHKDGEQPEAIQKVQEARKNWQAYGLPDPGRPENAQYWQEFSTKALGGSGGVTVENKIDLKGSGKFAEKANEYQAERYSTMVKAADEAVQLRGDIDTLADLSGKMKTGKTAEARLGLAQYAKEFGLDNVAEGLVGGKMSEMEAFSSIADKMTPLMRVPGSGTTSDKEMAVFRNALPSLLKSAGGNEIIIDTFRSLYDHKMRMGEISGQALRGEISQAEADKALREMESPFARFKAYRAGRDGAAPAAGEPAAGGWQVIDGVKIRVKAP